MTTFQSITRTLTAGLLLLAPSALMARSTTGGAPVPVTVQNFNRAETDMYFGNFAKQGAFGKFYHNRTVAPIEKQDVIRMNRDTLYSAAVFDLDAGPVTITLPDAGKRYMAILMVNEDAYSPEVVYAPGRYTFTKEKLGTRYAAALIRTLVDPQNPQDIKAVNALQDGIKIEQANVGKFEVPKWDPASQKKIRDALIVLAGMQGDDAPQKFGWKGEVNEIFHLLGTASGWGGNPPAAAQYVNVYPTANDGKTVYKLTVKDVPVDGFWSISVYNKDGYFQKNDLGAYSVNNITAKPSADGSVTVQFGGCQKETPNCLPTVAGWNYSVRMYRPRKEVLDGTWKFPASQPAK